MPPSPRLHRSFAGPMRFRRFRDAPETAHRGQRKKRDIRYEVCSQDNMAAHAARAQALLVARVRPAVGLKQIHFGIDRRFNPAARHAIVVALTIGPRVGYQELLSGGKRTDAFADFDPTGFGAGVGMISLARVAYAVSFGARVSLRAACRGDGQNPAAGTRASPVRRSLAPGMLRKRSRCCALFVEIVGLCMAAAAAFEIEFPPAPPIPPLVAERRINGFRRVLLASNPDLLIRGILGKRDVEPLRGGEFHLRPVAGRKRRVEYVKRRHVRRKSVARQNAPIEQTVEKFIGRWVHEIGLFVEIVFRLACPRRPLSP